MRRNDYLECMINSFCLLFVYSIKNLSLFGYFILLLCLLLYLLHLLSSNEIHLSCPFQADS